MLFRFKMLLKHFGPVCEEVLTVFGVISIFCLGILEEKQSSQSFFWELELYQNWFIVKSNYQHVF